MDDVQNIGLTHMDENHDFVKLYNATSNNETGNEHLNESISTTNLAACVCVCARAQNLTNFCTHALISTPNVPKILFA